MLDSGVEVRMFSFYISTEENKKQNCFGASKGEFLSLNSPVLDENDFALCNQV